MELPGIDTCHHFPAFRNRELRVEHPGFHLLRNSTYRLGQTFRNPVFYPGINTIGLRPMILQEPSLAKGHEGIQLVGFGRPAKRSIPASHGTIRGSPCLDSFRCPGAMFRQSILPVQHSRTHPIPNRPGTPCVPQALLPGISGADTGYHGLMVDMAWELLAKRSRRSSLLWPLHACGYQIHIESTPFYRSLDDAAEKPQKSATLIQPLPETSWLQAKVSSNSGRQTVIRTSSGIPAVIMHDAFSLAETETTVARFREFIRDNPAVVCFGG
jgi:hypothetical protein